MSSNLEYDCRVGRSNWTMVGLVAWFALAVSAGAQINAAPPSVTSLGFGGRAFSPLFPSVTSLGPQGYTPGFNPAFPNSRPLFNLHPVEPFNGHHHHHPDDGVVPWGGVYALPYYAYYDSGNDPDSDASQDPYNGGPTIFDRRGPGAPAKPQPPASADPAVASAPAPAESDPAPLVKQPATVLVFKDGRRLEIENYAIVGNTLYDLSGGSRRKIPLADLDLGATTKANDERGIDFQVPVGT
jgi:hypothetical protein